MLLAICSKLSLTKKLIVFWDVIGTMDILTDIALIAIPAMVVWSLHMQWQKKLVVVSAFAFRLV